MRYLWAVYAIALVPAITAAEPEPHLKFRGSLEGVRPAAYAAIAFSPNGKLLAFADMAREDAPVVKLWDVQKRRAVATLRVTAAPFGDRAGFSVAFSADGKTLIVTGAEVTLFDVTTGKEKSPVKGGPSGIVLALSPDGKTIASVKAEDSNTVILSDTVTGKQRASLKGFSSVIMTAVFSPDSTLFAAGGGRFGSEGLPGAGEVKLWDVATGRERASLKGPVKLKVSLHELSYLHKVEGVPKRVLLKVASLNGMEFPNDEDLDDQLAKALEKVLDKDQREKYLDVVRKHIGATRHEGPEVVWSVAFSPDGKTLVSGSVLGSVLLWDVQRGKRRTAYQKFNVDGKEEDINGVYSVAFSPDGKILAAGTARRGIRLWDVQSGEDVGGLNNPLGTVWSVAFSSNGKTLASAGSRKVIGRLDPREGDPILRLWEWVPMPPARQDRP